MQNLHENKLSFCGPVSLMKESISKMKLRPLRAFFFCLAVSLMMKPVIIRLSLHCALPSNSRFIQARLAQCERTLMVKQMHSDTFKSRNTLSTLPDENIKTHKLRLKLFFFSLQEHIGLHALFTQT